MPVISGVSPGYAPLLYTSTTAQDVINDTSQDVRSVLDATSVNDQTILLDFVSRIQLQILRASRWTFLLSDFIYFITVREQTKYYFGPAGQAPPGAVDTLLNLNDVDYINRSSVIDISNVNWLEKMDVPPYAQTLSFRDAQFRPGKPETWRNDLLNPSVIEVYPAPDNQNNWQPQPEAPYLSPVPGGALSLRTYAVMTTFVDSEGLESTPCDREGILTIPSAKLLKVHSPRLPQNVTSQGVAYNQYNVYAIATTNASVENGGELLQNASPIPIGIDWTEPTSGLLTNTAAPPSLNNITPMDGYIIGFRYFQQRQTVTSLATVLQVPDVYEDVIVAGVNWMAFQYLRLAQEAQMWQMIYMNGIRDMIRDRNAGPRENDYIHPDDAGLGIGQFVPYIDIFDYIR
jgi:hypothetical protein